MEFIEDKILHYRKYCEEDHRGVLNKKCRLTGEEILKIENFLSLAVLYKNNLFSNKRNMIL